MGQVQTSCRASGQTNRAYATNRQESIYSNKTQHEGLLTLRSVPFKNCIQIQTDSGSIFLENIQITLKDLLEGRMYTNKLFPKQDIERLIENVTYTLAFLADNRVPYKDICPENIFYDQGVFKLLPNQLINQSQYQRFLASRSDSQYKKTTTPSQQHQVQKQFITISPQMIIAYRCKQISINDLQILDKSCVFSLGMILLETCTLLPSHQCYDHQNCDILDEIVSERLEMVKQYYTEQVAAIVGNMLDYDYSQRMGLKELSIFVNRQLNRDLITNSKVVKQLSNKKDPKQQQNFIDIPPSSDPTVDDAQSVINHSQTKSVSVYKSRLQHTEQVESRLSRPCTNITNVTVSQKKRRKTNGVYMNGSTNVQPEEEETIIHNAKEQRNKVYMKQYQQKNQQEPKRNCNKEQQDLRNHPVLKQIPHNNNILHGNESRLQPKTAKTMNQINREKLPPSMPSYTQKTSYYQVNNEQQQQIRQSYRQDFGLSSQMRRKNSTDYLGYRAQNNMVLNKTPKKEKLFNHVQSQNCFDSRQSFDQNQSFSNKNYAYNNNDMKENEPIAHSQKWKQTKFGNRYEAKESPMSQDSGSRGYFEANRQNVSRVTKNDRNVDYKDHDNSLSRIKSEIERSRKLIQEFKRGENVQFS